MRRPLAAVVALAVAAVCGAILGEYDLTGVVPLIAGALFGVVVAEATALVGGRDRVTAVIAGVATAAGLTLSIWIISDHFRFVHAWSWSAVAVGPAAAALWIVRGSARPADGSPPMP